MNRRKLLTIFSLLFSTITIVLIVFEYIFVKSQNHIHHVTGWALLSLGLMFLADGLNRYLDRRQAGFAYLGVGLFVILVVVTGFALRR
jgi:hypothetical protein